MDLPDKNNEVEEGETKKLGQQKLRQQILCTP